MFPCPIILLLQLCTIPQMDESPSPLLAHAWALPNILLSQTKLQCIISFLCGWVCQWIPQAAWVGKGDWFVTLIDVVKIFSSRAMQTSAPISGAQKAFVPQETCQEVMMTCFHAAVIGFSLVTHEAQCIPITPTALCICSSTWCLFLSFVSGVLVSVGVLSLFLTLSRSSLHMREAGPLPVIWLVNIRCTLE